MLSFQVSLVVGILPLINLLYNKIPFCLQVKLSRASCRILWVLHLYNLYDLWPWWPVRRSMWWWKASIFSSLGQGKGLITISVWCMRSFSRIMYSKLFSPWGNLVWKSCMWLTCFLPLCSVIRIHHSYNVMLLLQAYMCLQRELHSRGALRTVRNR